MQPMPINSRFHGLLVRALPPLFRHRYGAELRDCALERSAEAPHSLSSRAQRRFWRREVVDLVRTIVREWAVVPATPQQHRLSPIETTTEMFRNIFSEIAYSARTLAKSPLYSLVIIATFALGVGATSAVFSVVDGVLLQPLDYEEPDQLVMGFGSFPANNRASVSPMDYLDYREEVAAFTSLAAATSFQPSVDLTGGDEPQRLRARRITDNLLATLGVVPALGRGFSPEDVVAGGPEVALISHALWAGRFASDPGVVNSTILLDDKPTLVVGVLPADFDLLGGASDLWQPIRFGAGATTVRRFHFLRTLGRLRPGVDLVTAQQQVDVTAERLAREYPDSNTDWTMALVPVAEARFGFTRTPLIILLCASIAVLLIGCSNIAVIVLTRSSTRAGEISIRAALGGSPRQIVRLILIENMLLAVAGGAAGLAIAAQVIGGLTRLAGTGLPRIASVELDLRVVGVALVVTIATGLLFGLVPALRAVRNDLTTALQGEGRTSPSIRTQRFRNGLVVAQLATSVALLIGAGLFLRSLAALEGVDLGFRDEGVLVGSVSLPESRYPDRDAQARFWAELTDDLAARPGVEAIGAINILPLRGGNDTWLYPEGEPPAEGLQGTNAESRVATDGYFDAMRINVVAGRLFDSRDGDDGLMSMVIDESLAAALLPEENPVGRIVIVDLGEAQRAEIIGVVGEVYHYGAGVGPVPTMYFTPRQADMGGGVVTLRSGGEASEMAPMLRTALGQIDDQLPLSAVGSMQGVVDSVLDGPRFRTVLLGSFAVIALVLAALGLYGVLGYFVAERRREMGLRMALGAEGRQVVRLVLRRGMALVAMGLALGIVTSLALGQFVASLLFNVSAMDPVAVASVAGLLLLIGWFACWIPARRTSRIDPVRVMRGS